MTTTPVSPVSSLATRTHPQPRPGADGAERLALSIPDLSGFTKSLRAQLLAHAGAEAQLPGHVQLLNMLARAVGHRNVQSLKAQQAAERVAVARQQVATRCLASQAAGVQAAAEPAVGLAHGAHGLPPLGVDEAPAGRAVLSANAAKALTQFDDWGRLTRWPHKFTVQRLAMWVLWARFDGARRYTEREVNDILKAWTIYGDHVTPRRELVEMRLLGRESDCSVYWKEPQRPDDEVRALLQALRARRP